MDWSRRGGPGRVPAGPTLGRDPGSGRPAGPSAGRVATTYVGVVVGAGFASGQEVFQFFGMFGAGRGLLGVAAATALLVLFAAVIMALGHRLRATSHRDVVRHAAGPVLGSAVDLVITAFLLGGLVAMAAGAGAVAREQFGLDPWLGRLAMVVAATATVALGLEGVITAISSVAPVLLAAVALVTVLTLASAPVNWTWMRPDAAAVPTWPLSAVAYASYNLVLSVPVLAPLGAIAQPRAFRTGAVLGGLGLGAGAAAILLAVMTQMPEAATVEVPMIVAAGRVSPAVRTGYAAILLLEVYTTAVASLYGFAARLAPPPLDPGPGVPNRPRRSRRGPGPGSAFRWTALGAGLVGYLAGGLGFATVVRTVYSAVGYAGFVLLAALAWSAVAGSRR